jgi:membrane protease YdiL (CAAX protease family)
MLVEWTFLVLLIAAWYDFRRPIEDLGIVTSGGLWFWIGTAACIVFFGYLVYAWQSVKKASEAEKSELAESFGNLVNFIPQTRRELHNFYALSVTAGIVEEIVYRGFVFWYLGQYMPLWAVVAVSSIAFGLGHTYQGASGALKAGLVGVAFGILYIATGTIWIPIIAHALLDALQGALTFEVLRERDDTPEVSPEEPLESLD